MENMMNREPVNKKSFPYKGQEIFYFIKDIEWKETCGKEMASALMVVCDENDTHNDVFAIYDDRNKVMYALPHDAQRWYEGYLSKKSR